MASTFRRLGELADEILQGLPAVAGRAECVVIYLCERARDRGIGDFKGAHRGHLQRPTKASAAMTSMTAKVASCARIIRFPDAGERETIQALRWIEAG